MNEQERQEFGAYLKKLRAAQKMTQKDAAKEVGISAPYLAQLEKGERNPPSRRVLSQLAATYQQPPEELWRKAEQADGRKAQPLDAAQIDWAFQAAASDPSFSYGHRARSGPLTLAQKAWFVELYEESTGRRLLVDKEAQENEADTTEGSEKQQ